MKGIIGPGFPRASGSPLWRRWALRVGFIDADACFELGTQQAKSGYGAYVTDVAEAFADRQS